MSRAPIFYPPSIRYEGIKTGDIVSRDHLLNILQYPYAAPLDEDPELYKGLSMGITAENVAEQYGITREEQDAFALDSQQKTARAVSYTHLKPSLIFRGRTP